MPQHSCALVGRHPAYKCVAGLLLLLRLPATDHLNVQCWAIHIYLLLNILLMRVMSFIIDFTWQIQLGHQVLGHSNELLGRHLACKRDVSL